MPGAQPTTRGPLKKSQPRPRTRPTRRDRLMKDPAAEGATCAICGQGHPCTHRKRACDPRSRAAPSATAAHGHVADAPATNPLRPRRPSRRRLRLPRRGPIKADSPARLKPFCVPGHCILGTIIAGAATTVGARASPIGIEGYFRGLGLAKTGADGILRVPLRGATVLGGNPRIPNGPHLGETVAGTRHHNRRLGKP